MDQTLLIGLALAVVVILVLLVAVTTRRETPPRPRDGADTDFAVSTEGMKVCPNCGMGNLWTERTCSACGTPLKG